MLVKARFPEPLALHKRLAIDFRNTFHRFGEVADVERKCPWRLGPGLRGLFLLPVPHVRHPHAPFGLHVVFRAGQSTEAAVPRAITEKPAAKDALAGRADLQSSDRRD